MVVGCILNVSLPELIDFDLIIMCFFFKVESEGRSSQSCSRHFLLIDLCVPFLAQLYDFDACCSLTACVIVEFIFY